MPLQELNVRGDWAERRPDLRPGGWAFQYNNAYYPDLDDTAVIVMAMDRARHGTAGASMMRSTAASNGPPGCRAPDGGWGAFDADNTYHYLNNIPFADHGALLDPPTVDVSARCVSMFAQLGETTSARIRAALDYLYADQLADGSWFGRWGVNYIYGTWSALCALNAAGVDPQSEPVRARGAAGSSASRMPTAAGARAATATGSTTPGTRPAASTASQTAWALLGLMAAGEAPRPRSRAASRGCRRTRPTDGVWPEETYTGGGFPRVFYLRYHGYPAYFPLWALARYRNLTRRQRRRGSAGACDGLAVILLTCGFITEARTAARPGDIHAVPGGGDPTYLATALDRLAPRAEGDRQLGPDRRAARRSAGSATGSSARACRAGSTTTATRAGTARARWRRFRARTRGSFHADGLLADAPAKRALGQSGPRLAVDMESHIAARVAAAHNLPFAILRVVSDRVDDAMPPAVLVSMGPQGKNRLRTASPRASRGIRAQVPAFAAFARHSMACLRCCRRAVSGWGRGSARRADPPGPDRPRPSAEPQPRSGGRHRP